MGRTIKVDSTTLAMMRDKFVWVYVEVDLNKPLKAGYRMRERDRRLQYEGLQDLYFNCERYGHREAACSTKKTKEAPTEENTFNKEEGSSGTTPKVDHQAVTPTSFGP